MSSTHQPLSVRRRSPGQTPASPRRQVVHDHAVLVICLGGTSRLWAGGDYTLGRGDVLLIPEGMPHTNSGGSAAELVLIAVCTSCMTGSWGESLRRAFADVRRSGIAVRRLDDASLDDAERLAARLADELARQRHGRALMIDGVMSQLTVLVERGARADAVARAAGGSPQVVAAALEFIETHATMAISLREVAGHVGRAPAHLAAVMKRHTGRTVGAWITQTRLAQARQLLLSSDDPVEAIAERVGMSSPSHFHRLFRERHGMTPRRWRQTHRAGRPADARRDESSPRAVSRER